MRILGAIIQVAANFLAPLVSDHLDSCVAGWTLISHHDFGVFIAFHGFSENCQRCSLIPLPRGISLKHLPFVVYGAPKVMCFTADVGFAGLRLTKTSFRCQRHWLTRRIASDLRLPILSAKYVPKRSPHKRMLSWQTSIPRSCRRSSTFRSDGGNRIYIITPSWMFSGEALKYRKGLLLIFEANRPTRPSQDAVPLTSPFQSLNAPSTRPI